MDLLTDRAAIILQVVGNAEVRENERADHTAILSLGNLKFNASSVSLLLDSVLTGLVRFE